MVRVKILVGDTDELVGEFDFEHLPRADESITVPWAADEEGLRIFDVEDVIHIAAGAPSDWGTGPRTILRACEIV